VVQVTLSHAVPTTDILYVFFDLATGTVASDGDQVSAQLDNVVVNTVTESDTVSIGTNTISNVLTINTDNLAWDSVPGAATGDVGASATQVQMLNLTLDSDLAGDGTVTVTDIVVNVSASGGLDRVGSVSVDDSADGLSPLGTNGTVTAATTIDLIPDFDVTSGNDPVTLYVFYNLTGTAADGETVTAQLTGAGVAISTGTENDTVTPGTNTSNQVTAGSRCRHQPRRQRHAGP
jgi:hypothetical protein